MPEKRLCVKKLPRRHKEPHVTMLAVAAFAGDRLPSALAAAFLKNLTEQHKNFLTKKSPAWYTIKERFLQEVKGVDGIGRSWDVAFQKQVQGGRPSLF